MTTLTVFLTIIGICLIVISFLFFEKDKNEPVKGVVKLNDYELDDEEMSKLQESIRSSVKEYSEQLVDDTDVKMTNTSNQRMMEINELAEQVIGDINKSREELVFYYNMLEDKTGALKEYVSTSAERLFAMQQDVMRVVPKEDRAKVEQALLSESTESKIKENLASQVESVENFTAPPDDVVEDDEVKLRNDKILSMYDGGDDVITIAKELNMGVGEVQLVIDLNRGE